MLEFLKEIVKLVLGFFISIFFVIIPTFFFNPAKHLPYLEHDLQIEIPKNGYRITQKMEDHFGFELHQEFTLVFTEESFSQLTASIEDEIPKNQCQAACDGWTRTENGYYFSHETETQGHKITVQSNVDNKEKTLQYQYMDW